MKLQITNDELRDVFERVLEKEENLLKSLFYVPLA